MTLIRHGTQALTGRARSHRTAVVPGAMQIPRNHSDSDVSCEQAPTARCRYLSPSFLASSSRPIFDRPGRSRRLAISYSSARVLGEAAPVRRRWATAAPCFPSAVRVFSGRCAIVLLAVAACWAFFTLVVAARRVLVAPAVAPCRVFAALDVAARRVLVAPVVALSWAFAALAAAAFWAFFALFLAAFSAFLVAFSAFLSAFFCFFFAIVPRFRGLYCPPPAGCLTGAVRRQRLSVAALPAAQAGWTAQARGTYAGLPDIDGSWISQRRATYLPASQRISSATAGISAQPNWRRLMSVVPSRRWKTSIWVTSTARTNSPSMA